MEYECFNGLFLFSFLQARMENGGVNYTQVVIKLSDTNDNAPIFEMDTVESYIDEDYPIHQPFFAVQAYDKDRGKVYYYCCCYCCYCYYCYYC